MHHPLHPNVRTVPLGEVASIFTGLTVSRRTSDELNAPKEHVVGVADLDGQGGVAPRQALEAVPLGGGRGFDKYRIQDGDVLLTARGTALKVAVVGPETAGALASSNLLVVRPDPSRLHPGALAAWLLGPRGEAELRGRTRSSALLLSLTPGELADVRVPVPSLEVQRQAAALIGASRAGYHSAMRAAEARRALGIAAAAALLNSPSDTSTDRS
jgi:hypothetical protein